jgi:hypothetical protein
MPKILPGTWQNWMYCLDPYTSYMTDFLVASTPYKIPSSMDPALWASTTDHYPTVEAGEAMGRFAAFSRKYFRLISHQSNAQKLYKKLSGKIKPLANFICILFPIFQSI